MPMQIGSLFQTNHENFMNLELHTSDNKKPLSTRVLSLKDLNQWNQADRAKVLELVVTQCLRWPKGIFKKICFKNSTLNHPRTNSKKSGNIRTRIKRMDESIRILIAKIS